MARKHNVKHFRSPSLYKERLTARGLGKAPTMPDVKTLRKKHGVKSELTI